MDLTNCGLLDAEIIQLIVGLPQREEEGEGAETQQKQTDSLRFQQTNIADTIGNQPQPQQQPTLLIISILTTPQETKSAPAADRQSIKQQYK